MDNRQRGGEWTVVIALGLIALGVWFLLGNVLGEWWQDAIKYGLRIIWPVSLIVIGLLLWMSSGRRGGSATSGGGPIPGPRAGARLYRSRTDRKVSGVLAGLADYLGIDPTLVRAAYLVLALLTGVGPFVVAYIIATIVIPEEPVAPADAPAWPQQQPHAQPPAQPPYTPPAPPAPPAPQPPPINPPAGSSTGSSETQPPQGTP